MIFNLPLIDTGIAILLGIIAFLLLRFVKTSIERQDRKLKLYLGAVMVFISGILGSY